MYDEELLYYSLKRIASTIERIIDNFPGMLETINKMIEEL